MGAFEKIKSGLEGLDKALENIRLGDNVVWQISNIEEYFLFAQSFAKQAIKDKRRLVYIRFANHKPILEPQDGLKIYELNPQEGFENFTVQVHEIIEREGKETFYVFDSLSELQTAWSADLMMGNFFVVTCPYLFELDTVAFFCIIRYRHSFDTIARIRETTQLFLDVYSQNNETYIHPLKVWQRYSPNMFLPHRFLNNHPEGFEAVTDSVSVSKFYSLVSHKTKLHNDQNLDSWERFFLYVKMKLDNGEGNSVDLKDICERLAGKEDKLNNLLIENFSADDLILIKERMTGSGKIGGKAWGMLLARKIIENNLPDVHERIEEHDSFYIGSDVFYTYIVQNGWWKIRLLQKSEEGYFTAAKDLKSKILEGSFPDTIREQFRRMLEYFGQSPIIVRSSSLLEDSFGNAFAGKYESFFCVNVGSLEDRLISFEKAVKKVYASTMDEAALEYRLQRGLSKSDEQMAILVQRVSGSLLDDVFMPSAAGVGYSYNSYKWHKDIDPTAGMIRLVMGLGTRAVDRTDGDYPRIVSLDKPHLTPIRGSSESHQYSQHKMDVLDLGKNDFMTMDLYELIPKLPEWYKKLTLEHDYETEAIYRDRGQKREILFTSCKGLIDNKELIDILRKILNELQIQYKYPVDIEFTVNFSKHGEFMINILQCRPLEIIGTDGKVGMPQVSEENIFFELSGGTMGGSYNEPLDAIIHIDPKGYYEYPYNKKHNIARAIGEINQYYKDSSKSIMLLAPGRIGTTSPELGVPVRFAEISNIKVICEVSYKEAGYMPELSFGSHFFQDLVEANIYYAAIYKDESTLNYKDNFFKNEKNILQDILPNSQDIQDVIKVYNVSNSNMFVASDIITGKTLCGCIFSK
ncbi:UNVERIFIED_CONTAM: Phosphoenolpyruvate synthase/pyruvate phosphate dikinase [Acetivibrio alkalicellulosi]